MSEEIRKMAEDASIEAYYKSGSRKYEDRIEIICKALQEAYDLGKAEAIPEGHVVVPKNPTEDEISSYVNDWFQGSEGYTFKHRNHLSDQLSDAPEFHHNQRIAYKKQSLRSQYKNIRNRVITAAQKAG